jgi:iron complex transport system substrate-binding protein
MTAHTPLRKRALPALSVLALVALAGCGTAVHLPSSQADAAVAGSAYPVTITNCGREVTVPSPPERIVGLSPAQTELLVRLGLGDRIAGQAQTEMHALPPSIAEDVASVPVLSTDQPPSREALLDVEPDSVLSPTEYEFTAERGYATVEQLTRAGVEADMIDRAGGENVFSPDEEPFAQFFSAVITPEEVIARNPDAFPGTLGNITAVRTIAEALHPEAFDTDR